MTFCISALPANTFYHLFALDEEGLAGVGGLRVVADASPGFPCRVSLHDAALGEMLVLVHWQHQPAPTPFRASHAVYVRAGATTARPAVGEIPSMLRTRTLSLRGFDAEDMLVAAELSEGIKLEVAIAAMLADSAVAYIHLHFARPGCYAARVDRARGNRLSG